MPENSSWHCLLLWQHVLWQTYRKYSTDTSSYAIYLGMTHRLLALRGSIPSATHQRCHLQSDDDVLASKFVSHPEPQVESDTAAPVFTVAQEIDALLGPDRTQLQDESEASHGSAAISEDDSLVAQAMAGALPHRSSLMEGSMDTADWTAFDQQAAMSTNPDDNLSWSITVLCLLACNSVSTP